MNELEALVALCSIPHLGPVKISLLLKRFGSAIHALEAEPVDLFELPGFGQKIVSGWSSWKQCSAWQHDLELASRLNAQVVPFYDPRFPKRLLELSDHPILLYVKGSLQLEDQLSIAVVGTRHPSLYGQDMAYQFGHDLSFNKVIVVSGLARGIDTAAHRGALKKGKTIAIIGSGLADIYPQENHALAEEIAEQGALISEFPMATPPDRSNFPQRNRIVSGMTNGTLLIEAPLKSGAMITMQRAETQGRRMFALPGRIDGDNFKGNHHLIKGGKAQLTENAQDVIGCFQSLFHLPPSSAQTNDIPLELEEKHFLELFTYEEMSLEEIESKTKLPIRKINVLLMSLIIKRIIKEYPGKLYKKCRIARS